MLHLCILYLEKLLLYLKYLFRIIVLGVLVSVVYYNHSVSSKRAWIFIYPNLNTRIFNRRHLMK